MAPSQPRTVAARATPVPSPMRPTRFSQELPSQLLAPETNEEVIDLIPQLLVYLNETFPRHCDANPTNTSQWNLQEGITHANALFDALENVLTRVDSPYLAIPKHQTNNLAQFVISGLAGFDLILSTVNYDSGNEKLKVVKALQDRAYQTLLDMLKRFSNSGSMENRTGWHGLRSLLQDMCSCICGLVQPLSPLSFPCTPGLFEGGKRPPQPIQDTNSFPFFASGGASLTCCTDVLRFATTLLGLCTETICTDSPALPYLQGIDRMIERCSHLLIDHCLGSPDCAVSVDRRIASAVEVYRIACLLSHHYTQSQHLGSFVYRILQCRVRSSENVSWDKADALVAEALALSYAVPPALEDIISILEVLQAGQWPTASTSCQLVIANFLRLCIRDSHPSALDRISHSLHTIALADHTGSVQNALQERQLAVNPPIQETQHKEENPLPASQLWEQRVRRVTSTIIGRDVDWMEESSQSSQAGRYANRAIQETASHIQGGLRSESADRQRMALEGLAELTCLVSHGSEKVCTRAKSARLIIPCQVIATLLDTTSEVPNFVKRKVYAVIVQCLRHYPAREPVEKVEDIIIQGLKDSDRMTRIQAGTALKALVELHSLLPDGKSFVDDFLGHRLYNISNVSSPPVQESLLLTVASIAKESVDDTLGLCLQFMFACLCLRNPVVRSISFTQLLGIFKYLGKSGLAVLSPYFRQLVPLAVSRLFSHPSLLNDLCLLIGLPPSGLLKQTARETLPVLIQQRNLKVLERVAFQIADMGSQSLGAVLFNHMSYILAHILLMPDPLDYNQSEQFLLNTLSNETGGKHVKMEALVKSCQVSLVADMMLVMGDEDPERTKLATIALRRIQGFLSPLPKGRKQGSQSENLVPMIQRQMLGIVTNFNEILYETKGRESIESKRRVLRALGELSRMMGPRIGIVQSQAMAAFQNAVTDAQLSEVALESWHSFLSALEPSELGLHLSATTASFVKAWPTFSTTAEESAMRTLTFLLKEPGEAIRPYLKYVANLEDIPLPAELQRSLANVQQGWTPRDQVERLISNISSENIIVSVQGLRELRQYFIRQEKDIKQLLTGDLFDPLIGRLLGTLLFITCRDSEGSEKIQPLALECISMLGAIDPDRCELLRSDDHFWITKNYEDLKECREFAVHLIGNLLAGAYKSTSDTRYQTYLAYTIQELCKFCQFKQSIEGAGSGSVPLHSRKLWQKLPQDVTQTVTPLLEGRYTATASALPLLQGPVYLGQPTYREWIQVWVSHLITRVTGEHAVGIFTCFRSAISYKDAIVAHHLLPHLLLHVLLSGMEEDVQSIRHEFLTVIQDQLNDASESSADKRRLSAQAVFNAFDHLARWVRFKRQSLARIKDHRNRRAEEIQLARVDSILSSIEPSVMAKAALQCKAYARALMNYEKHILSLQGRSTRSENLTDYYEQLHQIYSYLDEPDGMEGVSTLILSPSLEHQIRQHESSGKWTSAQSCWEVQIQENPDNVDHHLGLLRCLRNLGHHDTLRTHVAGLLQRNPAWACALSGFRIESAWLVGAWDDVQHIVETTDMSTSQINMAKMLLALRSGDHATMDETVRKARCTLGSELIMSGARGYRQIYDTVLNLHLTYELELIGHASLALGSSKTSSQARRRVDNLSRRLSTRLGCLPPTFRIRELVLSLRRTALSLTQSTHPTFTEAIGTSWLTSAKLARKAGQWQTAYSAVLQAQRHGAVWYFLQHAKLIKCTGEPVRALTELTNSMKHRGLLSINNATIVDRGDDVIEIVEDSEETQRLKAKSACLRGRWMNEQARYESSQAMNVLSEVSNIAPRWEGGYYHLGQFHDQCYKELSAQEKSKRGLRMCSHTVNAFGRAARHGSKHTFQTIPRMLTLWLDIGEHPDMRKQKDFEKITSYMERFIEEIPPYKWFIAFPQIASRVGHTNPDVFKRLERLIIRIIQEYPKQAIWGFISTTKSSDKTRNDRGNGIFMKLAADPQNSKNHVKTLITHALQFTTVLIELSDHCFDDERGKKWKFSLKEDFPRLLKFKHSPLLIPLQESLTVTLPPTSSIDSTYQPFPVDAPTIDDYNDEIEVMRSLARPRKICIRGSDGANYIFLGKPKDDLRKDARLMDLFSMINKFFKANSDSRRRQLHIRTYGVVTMNEACGFIQWVPNTTCLRPVLTSSYAARGIKPMYEDMAPLWKQFKEVDHKEAARIFTEKILAKYPPVFHEWFIESFPEPSEWLASRLTYGRTAAVMSMVGFILGLGDRHCENILLDENTGDVVHVDFNCLFEKGKALETPERVPFRLTHNMVDGLGVTGVEGVYSIACEITLKILREHRDSLMSVLDAFIHDPLVEWADERRRLEITKQNQNRNQVKPSANLQDLAQNSLGPIEKKLKGLYSTGPTKPAKELSEGHLVQTLINEATDLGNLGKMYQGWAAWY